MSRMPQKPPAEAKLIVPDEATHREVMELWNQVDRLAQHADIPRIGARAAQQQDQDSGLVKRSWERRSRRTGVLTEETLEGRRVEATWQDRHGGLQRTSGEVRRNAAGDVVVSSGDGEETTITCDASVDVLPRQPRSR